MLPAAARIVLVDDDDLVREGMEMMLDGAGFKVRSTPSALQALQWLEEEPCDLLILDSQLPEMNGAELFRRVLIQSPTHGPRVLFVSGRTELPGGEDDTRIRTAPLLIKPFTLGDFFGAVTRALEERPHVER